MSVDEKQWKWNEFVSIGKNIHKMKDKIRVAEAYRALAYAVQLSKSEFIPNLPIKDQQMYKSLLDEIACYLDGHDEEIKNFVETYFRMQHCTAGLDEAQFQISFFPKKSGIQVGFTCEVSNGKQKTRFYVKTHQYGPTQDNPKAMEPPDTKELFVYRLLQHIGVGPEAHFIVPYHGTRRTIYIATKDCHLTLLSNLTTESASTKALVQLDLISRILCLRDTTSNPTNCGQYNCEAMIVDFRIENHGGMKGYVKRDLLEQFYAGNTEFNHTGLMVSVLKVPKEEKLRILKESLQTWNLLENIDKTAQEMRPWFQNVADKIDFTDDLERYIQDVKETIEILSRV